MEDGPPSRAVPVYGVSRFFIAINAISTKDRKTIAVVTKYSVMNNTAGDRAYDVAFARLDAAP